MPGAHHAVLIALALAAAGAPALAAPEWSPPQTLSQDVGDAVAATGGVDATGAATVVWHQSSAVAQPAIMAATRGPGGTWSAPEALSAPGAAVGELPRPTVLDPSVAVSASGTAVAVWRYRDGGGYVIEAAVRPAGGPWSGPQVVSRAARRFDAPAVAVDPRGDAVALWVRHGQDGMTVETSSRPAGGTWTAPVTLSAPGATEAALPAVVATRETALAAWAWRGGPGGLWRVQAAARSAGGAWTLPRDVSGTAVSAPVPAVAAGGAAGWVAWDRELLTGHVAEVVHRDAAGAWGKPVELTDPDGNAGAPDLEVLGDGRVAVAVPTADGPASSRVTVRIGAAGAWGAPEVLGPVGELAVAPRLASLPGGLALAWDGCPQGNDCRTLAAVRDAAGVWTGRDPAGGATRLGTLVADPAGNLMAVGTRFPAGLPAAAQAQVLDAAGPDLSSAAVPETAVAGVPVNMSVAPVDVWSPLAGTPRWEFSDGGPAREGDATVHTFPVPGIHTVTVSQADVLGNASVVRRAVLVTAAPPAADVPGEVFLAVPVLRAAASRPLPLGGVRAVCGAPAGTGCRVAVSFRLAAAQRVRVRVALRGRSGVVVLTLRARRGINTVRLPARIAGVPLRPGVRLAITVRRAS